MEQDAGFEKHRKATRHDVFLSEMDRVAPWAELCAVIAPHHPKAPRPGAGGRRAVQIALSLNTRPRKRHDFRTPLQVHNEHLQLAEADDSTVH